MLVYRIKNGSDSAESIRYRSRQWAEERAEPDSHIVEVALTPDEVAAYCRETQARHPARLPILQTGRLVLTRLPELEETFKVVRKGPPCVGVATDSEGREWWEAEMVPVFTCEICGARLLSAHGWVTRPTPWGMAFREHLERRARELHEADGSDSIEERHMKAAAHEAADLIEEAGGDASRVLGVCPEHVAVHITVQESDGCRG